MKKPKIQILVKYDDFISYKEKYGTDILDENNVIWSPSKVKLISRLFPVNEEIFDGIKSEYDISSTTDGYFIKFKSKSNTEYRFDLLKEPNTDIYHLAFGLLSTNRTEYEELTDKRESLDVFNRLIWILRDIKKLNINKFFVGSTNNDKKNRIYQYMMRFVDNWEKRQTNQYDNGWGIYFEL